MADEHKLALYNRALVFLGQRPLASLTENRKPRRVLDLVWDANFVREVLSEGFWNFAARTTSRDASEDVTPPFGFRYAFEKPDDWVRTYSMCTDEFFQCALLRFEDEQGYWFADSNKIYVKYVSDDVDYGGNFAIWPPKLFLYAACLLAKGACMQITQDQGLEDRVTVQCSDLLAKAKGVDGSADPPRPKQFGSWVRNRTGGTRYGYSRNDYY